MFSRVQRTHLGMDRLIRLVKVSEIEDGLEDGNEMLEDAFEKLKAAGKFNEYQISYYEKLIEKFRADKIKKKEKEREKERKMERRLERKKEREKNKKKTEK